MISNEWKVLILAPLAASLLVGCGGKSDDVASAPPSSPYQGFWVNVHTAQQIESCRQGVPQPFRPLDAIFIQGDGQVICYADKQTLANGQARAVLQIGRVENNGAFERTATSSAYAGGYNLYCHALRDGIFTGFDGNHMSLIDRWGQSQNREFTRATETQLQNYQVELARCSGATTNPRLVQMQPPDGVGPQYPRNVDPHLVSPGQPQQGLPVPMGPQQEPVQPQPQSPPPIPYYMQPQGRPLPQTMEPQQSPGEMPQQMRQPPQYPGGQEAYPPPPGGAYQSDADEPWIQRPMQQPGYPAPNGYGGGQMPPPQHGFPAGR